MGYAPAIPPRPSRKVMVVYGMSKDPICGMDVDEATAISAERQGRTYHFCSVHCREVFLRGGTSVAIGEAAADHSAGDLYTCPMHPDIERRGPGACPRCGMALEPREVALDGLEKSPELRDLARRFWVSLLLTAPLFLMAMAHMLPGHSWLKAVPPDVFAWIQLVLATPVVLWGGWPFFRRGWASVVNRSLNMFTLIVVGTGVSYVYSTVAVLFPEIFPASFRGPGGQIAVYFEAAAVITTLVLLGQMLELRARSRAADAIRALAGLTPKTARRLSADGAEKDVPLREVAKGDRLRIRPGESVPVDGVVLEGHSALNEAMISGEPMPVEKGRGDRVTGGTINGAGGFVMRAERVGGDTLLAQIVRMVSAAQRSRAPIQRLADAVAAWFVPAVMATAVVTALAWGLLGPEPRWAYALLNAVAVLIIACPCALGLATPMSIMVGAGRGAAAGVLIRDAGALEIMEKVNTLVVDKTGTLTEGKPVLATVMADNESEVLRLAASVERASEHPLAAAIVAGAEARGLRLADLSQFASVPGQGVSGRVDGIQVAVSNSAAQPVAGPAEALRREGQTVVFVTLAGRPAGLLGITDPIKASAAESLRALRAEGIEIVMVTGDNHATAAAVARKLNIDRIEAGVLPEHKQEVIRQLQREGRTVAMAGDGVNDAPALAQANVGIAMGGGTDVAMASAGITLVKGDLRGIVRALRLSRAVMRNIRQNLGWAFAYNTLGVPVAAGILYPFLGILLSPMLAAAAMSFSSVSVVANALRLQRARI